MAENKKISVLIADDDENYLHLLRDILGGIAEVTAANNGAEALLSVEKNDFELALIDLMMPKLGGLELLSRIKTINPETVVIMMSGFGTVETSVKAMKAGAYDFIQKPFNVSQLRLSVDRALNFIKVKNENQRLRQLKPDGPFVDIIGNSTKIKKVFEMIKKIAKSEINVLIQGESGTGKELVAQAIHKSSHRKMEDLVPINCSAIPEPLLESSLFGHRKGAFSGAYQDYPGLLYYANGGTLFLDEIGDMPLAIQAKLLRVLQTHQYRPLGGDKEIEVNMRVIAATNHDLEADVATHKFREDLFYRLNVVKITVPPLRERESDIPQLARYFLKFFADPLQERQVVDFTTECMSTLKAYKWPGNVRELQNVIERAINLTESDRIQLEDLPPRILNGTGDLGITQGNTKFWAAKEKFVNEFEKKYLENALEKYSGNLAAILQNTGISRRQLFRMLKKNNLSLRDFR